MSRSPYAGASELVALGQAMREVRERRGVPQIAVSFDARVADEYIGRLEIGKNNPSFMVLLRAVRTLDSSLPEVVARWERILAEIDPQAGHDVPLCPTPAARRHVLRAGYQKSSAYYARKARRTRG
jgi:transcriptional regulator with XRE-family HTH domain